VQVSLYPEDVSLFGHGARPRPIAGHLERIDGMHKHPRHVSTGRARCGWRGLAQLDRPLPVRRRLGVAGQLNPPRDPHPVHKHRDGGSQ